MSLRHWLAELHRRDALLASVGWLHVGLFFVMALVAPFDERVVMGLNPWIKPMKFVASIGIYLWTVAWLMACVPGARAAKAAVRWSIALAMAIEMLGIALQAGRGTTSHSNVATPFDGAIFQTMGILIAVNTLAAAGLFVMFLRRLPVAPAFAWGIRLGTFVFLLGSVEGGS